MALVQISLEHVSLEKRPRGECPTFEMHLEPHQEVVGLHQYWVLDVERRETVDHHADVWVASRL